jgi:hypothetical protein
VRVRVLPLLAVLVAAPAAADPTPHQSDRMVVGATAGAGLLFGCCGAESQLTAEWLIGVHGGARAWKDVYVVAEFTDRSFVGPDGSQSHGTFTLGGMVRLGPAYLRLGLGFDSSLGDANADGPMYDYGTAFALAGALGVEASRNGRFGIILELGTALTYHDDSYRELDLSIGFNYR